MAISKVREIPAGTTATHMETFMNQQESKGYRFQQAFLFENKTYAVFVKELS